MNWGALADNMCPKCGSELEEDSLGNFRCYECDFKIGAERLEQILNDFDERSDYE